MKSGKLLITTSSLLLLLAPGSASAAERGLILLEDLRQSLSLIYQQGAQVLTGSGHTSYSLQNSFREGYDFNINYAIYNPRILKGRISLTASDQQEFTSSSLFRQGDTSSSSNNLNFQYNVYGVILERGYTPVRLYASSDLNRIQSSFSPGYDVTTDTWGISTGVRNRTIPVTLDFIRSTTDTSGLAQDRTQVNEQVAVRSSHTIEGLTQSDLELFRTDSTSTLKRQGPGDSPELHRIYEGSFRNTFTPMKGKYSLNTMLRLRDEEGIITTRNFNFNESASWQVGKALVIGAGYNNDTSRQTTPASATGPAETITRNSNSGNFYLTHRLFQNLFTRLDLNARSSELDNGTEKEFSGNLGFFYTKLLPNEGNLTLTWNELIDVTDRALTSDVLRAINEPMTVQALGQNTLVHPDVIDIVEVRDADPLGRVFTPGIDYSTTVVGAFTVLTFSSPEIPIGKKLLITYNYRQNPSIKYQTNSHRVGGTYQYSRTLKFYANIDKTDQKILSGRADQVDLNNSFGYQVGANWDRGAFSYGVENSYLDSPLDKHTFFDGLIRYNRLYTQTQLVLQARDRYSIYDATRSHPRSYNENLFSLNGSLTRPLFTNSTAIFTGSFIDSRGGAFARDEAELGLTFQWSYGKLSVKLNGKLNWIDLAGNMTMNENMVLEVKRYF